MMFKELTEKISYPEIEDAVLKFWEKQQIFEKSVALREGKPGFTFYEGPPTANGRPGIHHVLSRTIKDLVCRYKTMRGYQVHRKAGWDTHGLPVEIEVEKELGIKHKDEIVTYGIEKFNKACYDSVFRYLQDWEELTRRIGYWINLNEAYITCTNEYIESVWWTLKKFFDAGLIYKGYKIQPYCPRCETPLSSHEVSQGYEDIKDPSVYVRFKIRKGQKFLIRRPGAKWDEEYQVEDDNHFFLVWTTTPWTLISNVALAVNPNIKYYLFRDAHNNRENLILAEAAKERALTLPDKAKVHNIEAEIDGKNLAGVKYERLFNYHQVKEKGWYVVTTDFVTTEEGTGIVHMAPAYGEDDYQAAKKYGLPTIHPVNRSGEFGEEVTDFKGMFVKDADVAIIQNLKSRGLLYKKETIVHSYPHCWRCDSPLLYYARDSWYIRTTQYAKRMVELNKQINWYPPEVGEGRFGNWLEENKDWALSRDRFWGTPLPIWVCEKCGHQRCIGSIEELKRDGKNIPEPLDLHKPFVDRITLTCTNCGGIMRRAAEVIDAWFDSGSMPSAQWHYPFENRETFEQNYPADFIAEGVDQTRGWFYTLHAIGSFLFDKPAYKNVIVNELILDKYGQKMSKSRGNVVDPFEVVAKYGADATRWYLITNSPPWRATMFDEVAIAEVQRKFLGTLINTYSFFTLYANIDQFRYQEPSVPMNDRPEIDRWILSLLQNLAKEYVTAMENYDITRAARAVSDFTIDQLSNWYVRRNRRRFWKSEKGKDKLAAYQTLYECLMTVTKLMAPFAPFLADELYRNLNGVTKKEPHESVHLAILPEVNERLVDTELERRMEKAQRIVSLVRSIRAKSNLKVRQPLKRILLPIASEEDRKAVKRMEDVILEEINVKHIEYVDDDAEIVHKRAKPNFKSIGPKFGKSVQQIAERIKLFSRNEIKEIETGGKIEISMNGGTFTIAKEDLEIIHEDIKGWLVESDGEITVALDTQLTKELVDEGFAREFVHVVQNMRKLAGFQVTDRINIFYRTPTRLHQALQLFRNYITVETLAETLSNQFRSGKYSFSSDINGEACEIGIERVNMK